MIFCIFNKFCLSCISLHYTNVQIKQLPQKHFSIQEHDLIRVKETQTDTNLHM